MSCDTLLPAAAQNFTLSGLWWLQRMMLVVSAVRALPKLTCGVSTTNFCNIICPVPVCPTIRSTVLGLHIVQSFNINSLYFGDRVIYRECKQILRLLFLKLKRAFTSRIMMSSLVYPLWEWWKSLLSSTSFCIASHLMISLYERPGKVAASLSLSHSLSLSLFLSLGNPPFARMPSIYVHCSKAIPNRFLGQIGISGRVGRSTKIKEKKWISTSQ